MSWVPLPEFPGYEGTIEGKVRRVSTGNERSPSGRYQSYTLHLADGRVTSTTLPRVARIAARERGVPPIDGLGGRPTAGEVAR